MKRLFGYALVLAVAAAPAFAAKNSQSVTLADSVKVGSTEIPAGDVKVTWTGSGDSVQVTLAENGKTVTIPAKLVGEKHSHKGYIVSRSNGARNASSHRGPGPLAGLSTTSRIRPGLRASSAQSCERTVG